MEKHGFLSEYLPYLLHRCDQLLSRDFHQQLVALEIQQSEWRVMAVLHSFETCTVKELTEETQLRQPTVTHTVARLVKRGHASRTPDTTDRRQSMVSLTPAGIEIAMRLVESAKSSEDATFAALGVSSHEFRQELTNLIAMLETMNNE